MAFVKQLKKWMGWGAVQPASSPVRKTVPALDPRSYRRVMMSHSEPLCAEIAKITTHVIDISYTGVSVESSPELLGALKEWVADGGERAGVSRVEIPIHLDFGSAGRERLKIPGRFVRSNERLCAFEFVDVPAETRLRLDGFLDIKLVGLNMARVEPQHFEPGDSQSEWFAGPRDTHLLLWWTENGGLSRAVFQTGQHALELNRKSESSNTSQFELRQVGENSVEFAAQVIEQLSARLSREKALGYKAVEAFRAELHAMQTQYGARTDAHV